MSTNNKEIKKGGKRSVGSRSNPNTTAVILDMPYRIRVGFPQLMEILILMKLWSTVV